MDLKNMLNKERITDDKKCVNLLKQLFPVADSVEDLDLVLEMSLAKLTPETVISKFDEFVATLPQGDALRKGFMDFLSEYADAPESLDSTIVEYCNNSGIAFDIALDALNQWLPVQLKYEFTESF